MSEDIVDKIIYCISYFAGVIFLGDYTIYKGGRIRKERNKYIEDIRYRERKEEN